MDSRTLRRRVADTAGELGLDPLVDLEHDRDRGWVWRWTDGPTAARARAALSEEVADRVRLERRLSPRAVALAVLTEALHGRDALTDPAHVDDPAATDDERLGALADALSASVPDYGAGDDIQVHRHLREIGGPVTLLHPYTGTAADAEDPLAMTAAEHLTHRYLSRAGDWKSSEAWRYRLVTVDGAVIARHALADEAADLATRLAAVSLLGVLRAEMQALERAALEGAKAAGASTADLGRAMGVTRQAAHERLHRRSKGTRTRLSG